MPMTSLKYLMFVVIGFAVASNQTVPLVRNSIEVIRSIGKIPIFLSLPGNFSSESHLWIVETPITCFVAKYRRFEISYGVYRRFPEFMELVKKRDLKNVVFLVTLWPGDAFAQLYRYTLRYPSARVMIILSHGEDVPQNLISCSFMWMSDTTIDVPHENCKHGGGRTKTLRISGDTFHAQEESQFPKNIVLGISVDESDSLERNAYTRYPEAVAYLNALAVLNVTPAFGKKKHYKDIIIQPSIAYAGMLWIYDIGGVYTCFGHGFFGSRTRSHPFNVISLSSLARLLAALILVGAVITLPFCFTERVFPYRSCGISGLLLFLVATAVGRCPVPLNVTGLPFRVLLLLWLIGTFMTGAYIQSQITSECNVPTFSPFVETIDEFERIISSGIMFPCVDTSDKIILLNNKKPNTGMLRTLARVMKRSLESCLSDNEECYSRARDKTHLYIAPADFANRKAAREWGLRLGNEFVLTSCRVALAKKEFRYVLQHRRLVLALAESGLTLYEERKQTWNRSEDAAGTISFPFTMQFQVLSYGCAGSCVIFLCELLFNKMMGLKCFPVKIQ